MSIHIVIELDENVADVEHAIELAHTIEEVTADHCLKEVRVETGRDTLIEMTHEDFDILMDAAKEVGRLEVKAELLEKSKAWEQTSLDPNENDGYRERARTRAFTLKYYALRHI